MVEGDQPGIWVIDTSAIVQLRRFYDPILESDHRIVADANYLADVLDHLGALVSGGRLTFPNQVVEELHRASSPDVISGWVRQYQTRRQHRLPDYTTLRHIQAEILNEYGKSLENSSKTGEDADPWVVALAVDLDREGLLEAVVTEDVRNRGTTSITTACHYFRLPCIKTLDFLNHCGVPPAPSSR